MIGSTSRAWMRVSQLCGPIKRCTGDWVESVLRNYCARKRSHHEGSVEILVCVKKGIEFLLQVLPVVVVCGVLVLTTGEEETKNSPIIYYPTYYPVNREYFYCFVET